jgi:hypothetical protein
LKISVDIFASNPESLEPGVASIHACKSSILSPPKGSGQRAKGARVASQQSRVERGWREGGRLVGVRKERERAAARYRGNVLGAPMRLPCPVRAGGVRIGGAGGIASVSASSPASVEAARSERMCAYHLLRTGTRHL